MAVSERRIRNSDPYWLGSQFYSCNYYGSCYALAPGPIAFQAIRLLANWTVTATVGLYVIAKTSELQRPMIVCLPTR